MGSQGKICTKYKSNCIVYNWKKLYLQIYSNVSTERNLLTPLSKSNVGELTLNCISYVHLLLTHSADRIIFQYKIC